MDLQKNLVNMNPYFFAKSLNWEIWSSFIHTE